MKFGTRAGCLSGTSLDSDTLPCIARGTAHFYTATGLHETLRVTALVRKVDENVGLTSLVNINLRYYRCCAGR